MQTTESKSSAAKALPFAETHWSMVLRARNHAAPLAQEALEFLCRTYWFPLYGYVRRCGNDPATAQDLTQDFFVRFTQKNCLEHVDREKGKFRAFLLASLKNFLANERVRSKAQKRGGRFAFVSLEAEQAENRFRSEPFTEAQPDQAFDRSWAMTIVSNALSQMREEYVTSGKTALFEALQPYLSGDRDGSAYPNLARQLNTSEAAIKMAVVRLRRRFGQILRAQVGQTVASGTELDEEMRYLFAVLAQ